MLPFLAKDLEIMLRKLMVRCLEETALKVSSKKLLEIDVNEKENKLPLHQVQLGFSASKTIKTLASTGTEKIPSK